jgi:hypothetical protein
MTSLFDPDVATLFNLLVEERKDRLKLEARVRKLEISAGLEFGDPEEIGEILAEKAHVEDLDAAFWSKIKRRK